jgi:hypothetical protein
MTDNELKIINEALKKTRKDVKLSALYGRLLENELTRDEKWLLLHVLKSIATAEARLPLFVFTEKLYVDLEASEPKDAF